MFGVLLESRATRARRTASALLSLVSHTLVVCGAIVVTARENGATTTETWPPPPREVRWVAPPAPAEPGRGGGHTTSAGQTEEVKTPPRVPIDFSGPLSEKPVDITRTGVRLENIDWCVRQTDCAIGPAHRGEGDGRGGTTAFTTPSELMARIVGEPPRPRYPEALRSAGISGRVLVQFAVDTAGRVELQSVRVLESTHEQFERAVRDVLPRYRFVPAEVGGKRVRMTAQMPFEFAIVTR